MCLISGVHKSLISYSGILPWLASPYSAFASARLMALRRLVADRALDFLRGTMQQYNQAV